MLTIIIAIIICVFLIDLAIVVKDNLLSTLFITLCSVPFLLGLSIGILIPVSGYGKWKQVDEIGLVSLTNETSSTGRGFIYVSLSPDNSYTYRYEIKSEFQGDASTSKAYKTETLSSKNVEEIEDSNCKKPILKVYERKGKKSIWTFAVGSSEKKYVFYVPQGTISKEINLK